MDTRPRSAMRWLVLRDRLVHGLRVAAAVGLAVLALSLAALARVEGIELRDTLMLGLFAVAGFSIFLAVMLAFGRYEPARPVVVEARTPQDRPHVRARQFLPEPPPAGWTAPILPRKRDGWLVHADDMSVQLTVADHGGVASVRVVLFPQQEGAEPPSDGRCAELLGQLKGVREFLETSEPSPMPGGRTWYAVPRFSTEGMSIPEPPPEPREPDLSPHLVAARKYLPEKLPKGWSVPIAITEDHGTEWKDGAWMMGTGSEIMLACLCTSKGRVKLAVTIFRHDGEAVSEGTALELLRQFRGVLEFVQTDPDEDEKAAPHRSTYLGELQPARGERAMLN